MVFLAAFIAAFLDILLVRLFFISNYYWLAGVFVVTFLLMLYILGGLLSISKKSEEEAVRIMKEQAVGPKPRFPADPVKKS